MVTDETVMLHFYRAMLC